MRIDLNRYKLTPEVFNMFTQSAHWNDLKIYTLDTPHHLCNALKIFSWLFFIWTCS